MATGESYRCDPLAGHILSATGRYLQGLGTGASLLEEIK